MPWLQHAPDLGQPQPDIAQGPVLDHVPRQHEIEAAILERQRIGRSLTHAQRYAAGLCGLAHDRETGSTAVDRLDGEPVLGEKERVPADAAAEIECRAGAARL